MIQFNSEYSINQGSGTIVFEKKGESKVFANYSIDGNANEGSLIGELSENIFIGQFQMGTTQGLIEVKFEANGFDARWKQGLEPGPMKGKWIGQLMTTTSSNLESIPTKESSAQRFIDFIQANYLLSSEYGEQIKEISTADFVEDYSIEFDDFFFEQLKSWCDILVFRIENAEYSIDEQNGSEQYTVYYDLLNSCIYKQYPNHTDEYYCFLGTWHASIPNNYKPAKKFEGVFKVSDLDNTWEINFHGTYESHEGAISDDKLKMIKQAINPESMFSFLTEALECI